MPLKNHHPVGSAENPEREPKQFMFLFRHGMWEQGLTPEETMKVMDEVTAWFDSLVKRGIVVGGTPLMEGGKSVLVRNGSVTVLDGPFAESKEAVAGYLIVRLESEDEAVAIAKTSPLLGNGMVTEVREVAAECPVYERLREQGALLA
jgi:hypothetical protein